MQKIDERIMGHQDKIKEMYTMFKNLNLNSLLAQNTHDIQDAMKRPELRIIGVEENETLVKSTQNIFTK